MKLIAGILLFLLPGLAIPQVVNIAGKPIGGPRLESIRVPLTGVIAVSLASGQRALIQFTAMTAVSAEYRWKYRRHSDSKIEAGKGTVLEKYERFPAADGQGSEVLSLAGHDIVIRAGEIRGEWSTGGDKFCYFYYNPSLAKASLRGAQDFEGEP